MTALDRPRRLDLALRLLAETRGGAAAGPTALEDALAAGEIAEAARVDLAGRAGLRHPCVVLVLGEGGALVAEALSGVGARYVVFDEGVLEPVAAGLALRRVVPGVSARQVQARFTVPLVADERLAPIDGLLD